MNNDNFKWTDELVSECYREIRRRLDNPNEYEGTWEGISKEILKFKASNTSSNERDWEILEFRTPYFGSLDVPFTRNNVGNFSTGLNGRVHTHSEEYLLKMDATMKAVRRVSDGVVFSVGDEVEDKIREGKKNITSFTIREDDLIVNFYGHGRYLKDIRQPLPKRTKLFTELQRIEHLEERIAYLEKKLNIEG